MPYKRGHEGHEAKRVFQWAPLPADVPGVARDGVMDRFQQQQRRKSALSQKECRSEH